MLVNIKAGTYKIKVDPADDIENRVIATKHLNDNKLKGTKTPLDQSKIKRVSLDVNVVAGERTFVKLHFIKIKGTKNFMAKIIGRPELTLVEGIDETSKEIKKVRIAFTFDIVK